MIPKISRPANINSANPMCCNSVIVFTFIIHDYLIDGNIGRIIFWQIAQRLSKMKSMMMLFGDFWNLLHFSVDELFSSESKGSLVG